MLLPKFPEAHFVGVDAAPSMVREAQRKVSDPRVQWELASASQLPFENQAFDWVTCCNSLHAFPDGERALGEMIRVLKGGGRLLILDWNRDSLLCKLLNRWCRWFDPAHVWMYTTKELSGALSDLGLAVERIDRFRVPFPDGFKLWEMMSCVAVRK
jgi:ubiquinone/menaquinone biosynthesis C-methylase UbiE